jgi:uncharacterized RDD family membrane protein YckC
MTIQSENTIRYARLLPRVRALVVNLAVYVLAIAVFVMGASLVSSNTALRINLAVLVAFLLLYEPILVWRYGGTWGHMRYNLRVVSDRTGGNPTLATSFVRCMVKGTFGGLSLFFMALTRRHQALHDSVSRTTVQVRDPGTVRDDYFVAARTEPVGPADVSGRRRLGIVVVYELALVLFVAIAIDPFVSEACLYEDRCTEGEDLLYAILGVAWTLAAGGILVLGWKGRLWGARTRVV